jgi:membrane protein
VVRDRTGLHATSLTELGVLSWVVLVVVAVPSLATLYHVAPPIRAPWRRCLPGAGVAVGLWLAASVGLRTVVGGGIGGASVFGPLAAPVALLVWLYLLALAVLVGAALNTTLDALGIPPATSFPGADRGLVDDRAQVAGRHAEGGGDVAQPVPIGAARAVEHEHQVGEPA